MTRLPRSRKGKTPIDVTTTGQNGLKRVRLTVGHDGGAKFNSDLDPQEAMDLLTILTYHLSVITGQIEDSELDGDIEDDDIEDEFGLPNPASRDAVLREAVRFYSRLMPGTAAMFGEVNLTVFVNCILENQKIHAIKLMRSVFGETLKEAKDHVDFISEQPEMRTYEQRGI